MAALAEIGVLVLDDFIVTPPRTVEAKDLLEVIDDRSQVRSTSSSANCRWRTGIPHWPLAIPTLADAIVDRLVNNARRLALKGNSMRRRQPEEPPSAAA
ncbi:MAG: ATP-binding protein [Chloroflexi bacterium]|nr:ATP-binding protein [Chloroflexota bacterium]